MYKLLQAVQSGLSAAHVAVNARDSNRFDVSVNVEPQKKAGFYLSYEELLQREKDQYEVVVNIHPGQLVKDLQVEVLILLSETWYYSHHLHIIYALLGKHKRE